MGRRPGIWPFAAGWLSAEVVFLGYQRWRQVQHFKFAARFVQQRSCRVRAGSWALLFRAFPSVISGFLTQDVLLGQK